MLNIGRNPSGCRVSFFARTSELQEHISQLSTCCRLSRAAIEDSIGGQGAFRIMWARMADRVVHCLTSKRSHKRPQHTFPPPSLPNPHSLLWLRTLYTPLDPDVAPSHLYQRRFATHDISSLFLFWRRPPPSA
jgi:hypothetical protein